MLLTESQIMCIHKALHNKEITKIKVNNGLYLIELSPEAKCRFVKIGGLKFIEQNPNSTTEYAKLAREQSIPITWAIPSTRGIQWGLIINNSIVRNIPEY